MKWGELFDKDFSVFAVPALGKWDVRQGPMRDPRDPPREETYWTFTSVTDLVDFLKAHAEAHRQE